MKKKIVAVGGGNGTAVVLCALKPFIEQLEISAIITTADSGTSSGVLRKEFGSLPSGDLLRAVLALSKYDYEILKTIFRDNRFSEGKLAGHNLGNLFLVLAGQYAGNMASALRALEAAVEAQGFVFPVTLEPSELHVQLINGKEIVSEALIDRPAYDRSLTIAKAWLDPVEANPEALAALRAADHIIIGPGSLYTSLVAALLPTGVQEAIAASAAKLWYITPRGFEADGETGPEKLSHFVRQLEAYVPRQLDMVLYNNCTLDDRQLRIYAEKKWQAMELDASAITHTRVVGVDFEDVDGGHSAEKLSPILRQLLHL